MPGLIAGLAPNRFEDAARAILTTDLVMKTAHQQVRLKKGAIQIAGMTKGSGMIHPNMATTLGFVMMDAALPPSALATMLAAAVKRSYNRISVDGDTSTNDTMLVLANGASGIQPNQKESKKVEEALTQVMEDLARQIVRDGEGARKLVTIDVTRRRQRRRRHADRAQYRKFTLGKDRDCGLRSRTGAASFRPPGMQACRWIRRRWTSICKACPSAAADWPPISRRPN